MNQHFHIPKFSCIILAGGKSSRMGTDKALLQLNNQPLLTIICERVQKLTKEIYVVTPWIERYEQLIPKDCNLIEETLLDGKINNGPIVGFAQGLKHTKTEWVLLLACDLPCLETMAIAQWSSLLAQTSSTAIALLPKHPTKGWEPLIGFYRTKCLPLIEQYIAQGERSLQKWLTQQEVIELPVNNRQLLYNCNTPEDWQWIRFSKEN